MASRDLKSDADFVQSITPQAMTATVHGTGADLRGYDSASFHIDVGVLTDGTHTLHLEESDDNNSFTDIAAGDLIGTLVAVLVSATPQRIGYRGAKRYIRASNVVSGGPGTGLVASVTIVRSHAAQRPLA